MAFWQNLLGRDKGAKSQDEGGVRIVLHPDPFDFKGVDRITILDRPISGITTIPFASGRTKESIEPYDPKRHFTMDGRVPDTVHRFVRPNGVPLDFLVKDGVLIQVTDNAAAYR